VKHVDIEMISLVNDTEKARDVSYLLGTHHVEMTNIMTTDVSVEFSASFFRV
jgi:hypothetical protein